MNLEIHVFNKTNCLLIWLMLLLAACAQAPEDLSNAQARELIKAHLNRPELFVALGDVRFVTGDEDLYKGRESVTRRGLYQELADAKLITLTNQRDLTGGFSGWGDFFELSQAGVRATVTVAATAKGQALHDAQGDGAYQGAPNVLRIRIGTYEPLEIASNELITSAQKEHYRVVVATDDFFPNPELSEIPPEGGHWAVSKERRFRALFKLDLVTKKWNLIAHDTGDRARDFRENNVGAMIQEAGLVTR